MAPPLTDDGDNGDAEIRGVVVGFDGSPSSDIALDWAADAAATHGLPLTLLAARPDAEADVVDLEDAEEEGLLEDHLAGVLEKAEQRAAAAHPGLEVQTVIHPDSPVDGLLEASQAADLIVLGSRGLGGFQGLLLGSTTMNVTPYADCPVVVLYEPDEATAEAKASARHPDEIVVGYDGSEYATRALTFALRHAEVTGLGVAVVCVSKGKSEQPPVPVTADSEGLSEAIREDITAAGRIAGAYPDVRVTFLHAVGRPAGILIREAAGAALAVVGVRGRGGFAQLLLGSVGLQMLIHAECPVAIVRETHHSD
jgi:nucleotide-binding universal stress UspA family protein